jgi:hypothetical protein
MVREASDEIVDICPRTPQSALCVGVARDLDGSSNTLVYGFRDRICFLRAVNKKVYAQFLHIGRRGLPRIGA